MLIDNDGNSGGGGGGDDPSAYAIAMILLADLSAMLRDLEKINDTMMADYRTKINTQDGVKCILNGIRVKMLNFLTHQMIAQTLQMPPDLLIERMASLQSYISSELNFTTAEKQALAKGVGL